MVIVLDGAHVSYVGCCVCSWRGCINLVGCPWWGKIEWLKSLNISEGMFRIFNSSMVFVLDGAHVHTSYVVYVHRGCIDLVGYPWCGKNRVVKEFKHL